MQLILDSLVFGIDLPYKARFKLVPMVDNPEIAYLSELQTYNASKTQIFRIFDLILEAAKQHGFKTLRCYTGYEELAKRGFKKSKEDPYAIEKEL